MSPRFFIHGWIQSLRALGLGVALSLGQLLPAQSGSLLPNPEFTLDKDGDVWPDGWPRLEGMEWGREEQRKFLRIAQARPGQMHMVYQSISIPAGVAAFELTVESRVRDLVPGPETWNDARIILQFKDAAKKLISPKPRPLILAKKGSKEWSTKTSQFRIPAGAATLELMTGHFMSASGALDISLMQLRPYDAEALAARATEHARRNPPPKNIPREQPDAARFPAELFVRGNRLRTASGAEVWLQGANVPSLEWSVSGERVLESASVLFEKWKVNNIRLPLQEPAWFGRLNGQTDGGKSYRELVDAVVTYMANRGAYVVLDLHHYRAPKPEHVVFWQDAAARYANHPAVLFDLLNEPHSITWEVWRDGGEVFERKTSADEDHFLSAEERAKARKAFRSPGMQALVDTIRATGARNVIVAGGLDWAYDLSGVVKGYALSEPAERPGNGIMYSTHIYPWKRNWQAKVLEAAQHHPIYVGEVGADTTRMTWMPAEVQENPETWVPDMLGLIQKHRLNWAAWCFHPSSSPRMLEDWTYTPTSFWGKPAFEALRGSRFVLGKLR